MQVMESMLPGNLAPGYRGPIMMPPRLFHGLAGALGMSLLPSTSTSPTTTSSGLTSLVPKLTTTSPSITTTAVKLTPTTTPPTLTQLAPASAPSPLPSAPTAPSITQVIQAASAIPAPAAPNPATMTALNPPSGPVSSGSILTIPATLFVTSEEKPLWKRPAFWAVVGGIAVAGGAGIYLARRRRKG